MNSFSVRLILFLFINIGVIIFVSVILKQIKIIFTHDYLRCCKIPKEYSSNSSNISDTSLSLKLHRLSTIRDRLRIGSQSRKCQQMIEWTGSTVVTSIQRQNNIEKSTQRTHRYFVDFESRIHVEISTSNRYHNFHVDSPFKINEISTNFPRGISTSNRWRIDEAVSIGIIHSILLQAKLYSLLVLQITR